MFQPLQEICQHNFGILTTTFHPCIPLFVFGNHDVHEVDNVLCGIRRLEYVFIIICTKMVKNLLKNAHLMFLTVS